MATIKYYLREGLLPAGERTSPNQARYGEEHVRRLKLIRALVEVGGLSVATVREVVAAVDSDRAAYNVLGVMQGALTRSAVDVSDADREWAMGLLGPIARAHGWKFGPDNPAVEFLVGTVCTIRSLGHQALLDQIGRYAEVADRIAVADLDTIDAIGSMDRIVEAAVVGTVLGDRLFEGLRRLAQAAETARRYSEG
ncbi:MULTISPECIES: MerR family transcriptional regulator [Amycolatopsis]|uniref:MerR family transcriptional regulator n=1 Tax=Amycolatopsis TaxID=1813 RepID=UPI0028A6FB62|nr:MerR family transcriptional regulator [Amycolatopsis dendrobii]